MKRTKCLLPWLALLLVLSLSLPALAQAPTVISTEMMADFPQSITFKVKAESTAPITKLVLRYQVERLSCFPELVDRHPDFTPGRQVETQWTWQMRKTGGLPPGTRIIYQWFIEDAQGGQLKTEPALFTFEDSRYPWQSLSQGNLSLFWYYGDEAFAQELLGAGLEAVERLEREMGVRLERGAKLYIYENATALQGARIFPQPWEGGVSFSEFATVAIGIHPSQLSWGQRSVAHELAHQVIYQATYNCYSDMPTWLSEGLAMYAEGPLSSDMKARLEKAIASNSLLSVPTLASSFPVQAEAALLSYAQSFSVVEFLLSLGRGKLNQLLQAFKEGSGYDQALVKVYNWDMSELDVQWRRSLGLPPRLPPTPGPATPQITPIPTPPQETQPSPGLLSSCQRGARSSKDLGSLLFLGLYLGLGLIHWWRQK